MKLKINVPGPRCTTLYISILFFLSLIHSLWPPAVHGELLIPLHVQKGTNLIHIARRYCSKESDWKAIAEINGLKSPYTIYADATLRIPLSILRTKDISAKVASVNGSPRLITGSQTHNLNKGDLVLPGQTIITGRNEYVHIMYPDNKHTRIGPNSELTLVYLIRLADDNLQAKFRLIKGKIIHILRRRLKINEHFETITPMAITGVRGTEFRLKMEGNKTNIIETLKGQVAINAAGKHLVLNKGKGSIIKKGLPPLPPRDLPARPELPQLERIYRTLPVRIDAPGQPDTESTRLRVTTDKQGLETVTEALARPGQSFSLQSLADGNYHIFLTALSSDGLESLPAGPASLHIRTIPAAPVLSKPNNGLKTFSSSILIRWLKSEHAQYYTIEIASDAAFSTLLYEQQTRDAFFTTAALSPGDYFFRVRLVTKDGFTTLFSKPLSWTVLEQPKLDHMDTTTEEENGITLRWSAVPGMSGYMLQVAKDKEFTKLLISRQKLTEPSYTITDHLTAGKYFVRMRAVTTEGRKSPWTQAQVMTIDPEPFGIVHVFIGLSFIVMILL